MGPGARTPEELDALLEDTFVLRDCTALPGLFEPGAVLASAQSAEEERGAEAIARWATARWESDCTYIADPRRILQARDLALVLGEHSIHVVRRGRDGAWRYAISLLTLDGACATRRPADPAAAPKGEER